MRRGLLTAACWAAASVGAAQPVYNPAALTFEHADAAITTVYVVEVVTDVQPSLVRYTVEVPVSAAVATGDLTPDGPTYRLPLGALPALPSGTTFHFRLRAKGVEHLSDPSNLTPVGARFNPCARPNSAGIAVSRVEPPATWPTFAAGSGTVVTFTVTAPSPVQTLSVDLIGDNAPAWTYPLRPPTTGPVAVFLGPFLRAGRYRLEATILDGQGCQASLPYGHVVTVVP